MRYKILKIVKVSDNYYDVDYKEVAFFSKSKTFKKVRTECRRLRDASYSSGVIVSTGVYINNFGKILDAYNYSDVDFTERSEPLPEVSSFNEKAIY